MSKAKLTMSGFRGFFHKRNDNKFLNKAGDKKVLLQYSRRQTSRPGVTAMALSIRLLHSQPVDMRSLGNYDKNYNKAVAQAEESAFLVHMT